MTVFHHSIRRHFWGGTLTALTLALLAGCGAGGDEDTDWLFPLWVETSVLVRDIDGNGLPDVVTTANLGISMGVFEGRVKVRRQTSAGVFAPPEEYTTGMGAWMAEAADVDGDGRLDLVVAEPTTVWGDWINPGAAWLLQQDAQNVGRFLPPRRLILGPNVYDLDVADLTGDGVVDVALTDSHQDARRLIVLPQDAAQRGSFLAPLEIPMPGPLTAIVARDLNADGWADLATGLVSATRPDYSYDTSIGVTLQAAGSLGPTSLVTTFAYGSVGHLAIHDFNADGRPDIGAYFNRLDERAVPAIRLLLQGANGSWTDAIDSPIPVDTVKGRDDQVVADVNGDGRPDFVFAGTYPEGTTSDGFSIIKSRLTLVLQDGSGHFVPSSAYALPILATNVGAGDINGDGRVDLVIYGSEVLPSGGALDKVMLLLQSSTAAGQFLTPVSIP